MNQLFSKTFRIKLETGVRVLQQYVSSCIKQMGFEVAASVQNQIFTDMLTVLWSTRYDDEIRHIKNVDEKWELFTKIITDELNTMNQQVQSMMQQPLPEIMKLNKYELLMVSTCDRITDLLNAEFSLLEKQR